MSTAPGQLGPRIHPPFLVRFGIWIVVGALGVVTAVAALVSYPDEMLLPVHPLRQVPLRAGSVGGKLHFRVPDGSMVKARDLVATVEVESGSPAAVIRIPSPYDRQFRVGQRVFYETSSARKVEARVDAMLPSGNATEVRLTLPRDGGQGIVRIDGQRRSVLARLVRGLWTH